MSGGVADDDSVIVNVLGYMAAVCIVLLMAPQIYHNSVRKSVEGLSLLMVVVWHAASTLVTGYAIAENEVVPLIIMWGLNAVSFVVVEVQFVLYHEDVVRAGANHCSADADNARATHATDPSKIALEEVGDVAVYNVNVLRPKTRNSAIAGVLLTLLTVGGAILSFLICKYTHPILAFLTGSIIPSILLGFGFLPQMKEIFVTKSTEGFSLGVTMLDITGCTCALLTVIITAGGVGHAVPFVVLLLFQCLLLLLLVVVYPTENMKRMCQKIGVHRGTPTAAAHNIPISVMFGEPTVTDSKVETLPASSDTRGTELERTRVRSRPFFVRCLCL